MTYINVSQRITVVNSLNSVEYPKISEEQAQQWRSEKTSMIKPINTGSKLVDCVWAGFSTNITILLPLGSGLSEANLLGAFSLLLYEVHNVNAYVGESWRLQQMTSIHTHLRRDAWRFPGNLWGMAEALKIAEDEGIGICSCKSLLLCGSQMDEWLQKTCLIITLQHFQEFTVCCPSKQKVPSV